MATPSNAQLAAAAEVPLDLLPPVVLHLAAHLNKNGERVSDQSTLLKFSAPKSTEKTSALHWHNQNVKAKIDTGLN